MLLSMVAGGCAPKSAVRNASPGQESPAIAAPVGKNLLRATDFNDGKSVPWTTSFTAPALGVAEIKDGAYCITVQHKGVKRWDAQFRHREFTIQKNHAYTVKFKAWGSSPTKARLKVGMSGPPYLEYWSSTIELGTAPQLYVGSFTMLQSDDATAELAFHVGGDMAVAGTPFDVCIDEIHLDDPEYSGVVAARSGMVNLPKVLVNQLGYLPRAKKVATLQSGSPSERVWELVDASGKAVAKGTTTVFGDDAASGEHVHLIDFTTVKTEGAGYQLRVDEETSFPFDIDFKIYSRLKYDAFAYFYHNRSGIEVAMPFAGDARLARPAGHLTDASVKCLPGTGCDYALDVSGGWYDAGDHGKYVVNGGISVWTLLNLYERTQFLGTSMAELGDGKLAIPENKNGVPDVLDEARWELEFLLRMQVPDGKTLSGMVHHKMHDESWTGLAVAPHEDKLVRYLHKPSTAATLNLAATAAQGARIWRTLDAAFAARCLKSAERAWRAAAQNPSMLAAPTDDQGGGAYSDTSLTDEFYWAAAELFASTGKPEYRQAFETSPLHARFPTEVSGHVSSMNWGTTDALGMISLAVVPKIDAGLQKALRSRIVQGADRFLKSAEKEGYKTPLERTPEGKYLWGSNSFVLNNMIVLALAYDFTKHQKYLDGVVLGMDYLLGRNPLAQSYVTGYGEKPVSNPHHRFWAFQANEKYPKAPPGAISGGPNSNIQDPYSSGAGLRGCAPQKCYVDHIEAFGVNEITINWNAPFAWVASWLDERAKK